MLLAIRPNGEIQFIYSDALEPLLHEGEFRVERASRVEPAEGGGWTATMNDGTVLGPYKLRSEALAAEVRFLEGVLFHERS
jgi:hypothetical protein